MGIHSGPVNEDYGLNAQANIGVRHQYCPRVTACVDAGSHLTVCTSMVAGWIWSYIRGGVRFFFCFGAPPCGNFELKNGCGDKVTTFTRMRSVITTQTKFSREGKNIRAHVRLGRKIAAALMVLGDLSVASSTFLADKPVCVKAVADNRMRCCVCGHVAGKGTRDTSPTASRKGIANCWGKIPKLKGGGATSSFSSKARGAKNPGDARQAARSQRLAGSVRGRRPGTDHGPAHRAARASTSGRRLRPYEG